MLSPEQRKTLLTLQRGSEDAGHAAGGAGKAAEFAITVQQVKVEDDRIFVWTAQA